MTRTILLAAMPTATGLFGLVAFRAFAQGHTLAGGLATATALVTGIASIAIFRFSSR